MVKYSKDGISLPYYVSTSEPVSNKQDATRKRTMLVRSDSFESRSTVSSEGSARLTPRVSSHPALSCLSRETTDPSRKRMKCSLSSAFLPQPILERTALSQTTTPCSQIKPDDCLRGVLQEMGQSSEVTPIDPNSFLSIECQQHPSYPQAALAARNEDLDALRTLHAEGQSLQCANRFGESIIHIICRRSRDDILRFLISEAGVSVRLMDDHGRTPLHDAAWTDKPNFKVAALLLSREPDLIHTRDKRGNSPLAYVPRRNWGLWNDFLQQNKDLFAREPLGPLATIG